MRYVLLLRNDDPVAAGLMLSAGRDGAQQVRQAIEQFGGWVQQVVPVAGRYDAVILCDLPSHAELMGLALSARASGYSIEAMPATTDDDLDKVRQISQSVAEIQSRNLQEESAAE